MHNPIVQIEIKSAQSPHRTILLVGFGSENSLMSAAWSREIGENTSQCTLEIDGSNPSVVDTLLGLKLYEPQTSTPATQQPPTNSGSSVGKGGNATTNLEHETKIIQECLKQGVTDRNQIAYILATAKHESDQFRTQTEYSSGSQYEGRDDLGNTQSGDGVRFKGRGYVQLTGRANYKKYADQLGVDLVGNPNLISTNQDISRFILVDGMMRGTFTSRRLGQYVGGGRADYVGARAVVNGSDRADLIATIARTYQTRLESGDLSSQFSNVASSPIQPEKANPNPTTQSSPKMEVGGQIIIRSGEYGSLVYEDLFLLSSVGFEVGSDQAPIIRIGGISPVWSLNQHKQTDTKTNLTLKQLAQITAQSRSLTLDFEGDGLHYIHLENNGLTPYQLLLRESKRSGYVIRCEGTKLICFPMKPKGNQPIQIALADVLSLSTESKPSGSTPGVMSGLQGTWTAKPTVSQDTKLGITKQTALQKPVERSTQNRAKGVSDQLVSGAKHSDLVSMGNGKQVPVQLAQAELSRVMDLPTKLDLIAQTEYLAIVPCNLVSLNAAIQFSDMIGSTTFWVSAIHFSMSDSGFSLSLDLFKPGASVPTSQAMNSSSPTNQTPSSAGVTGSSSWQHPYPGSIMTAPWGEQRGNRRHAGQDFSGGNGRILASNDGTVSYVESGCRVGNPDCGGGYGNHIDIISNVDGRQLLHRYAHLQSVSATLNQSVQKGQQIGVEGNTGRSFGNHLHFEIRFAQHQVGFGGSINPASYGIK